jgi:hypothetical protein
VLRATRTLIHLVWVVVTKQTLMTYIINPIGKFICQWLDLYSVYLARLESLSRSTKYPPVMLSPSPVHDLMDSLIRNIELPREFGLRYTSCVSGTNDDVAFFGERRFRRLRQRVELGEQVLYGGIDRSPGRTVLGPNSPSTPCSGLEISAMREAQWTPWCPRELGNSVIFRHWGIPWNSPG